MPRWTSHFVLKAFDQHRNEMLTTDFLMQVTGLDRDQVLRAVSQMRRKGLDVETILPGEAFRYKGDGAVADASDMMALAASSPQTTFVRHPEQSPVVPPRRKVTGSASAPSLFEYLATTPEGNLILKGDDGNVYQAKRLS